MSRTLADIVEDEAEARHTVALDLVRDDCRALRVLAALCDTRPDSERWTDGLVAAISSGDIQLFLDSLLVIPQANASPQLRRDVEALSLAIRPDSASREESQPRSLAIRCQPLAQAVFTPASFQLLLGTLEIIPVAWEADNLGNFALFMETVRGDMDAAQRLYERAIEADPRHANILGNFALFMETVRGEMDAAQRLYERAIEADPRHANILGNFALFMETACTSSSSSTRTRTYPRSASELLVQSRRCWMREFDRRTSICRSLSSGHG
jgi:tetratricopeptide (TPR) repeat protein